jgi:hypothetical protein
MGYRMWQDGSCGRQRKRAEESGRRQRNQRTEQPTEYRRTCTIACVPSWLRRPSVWIPNSDEKQCPARTANGNLRAGRGAEGKTPSGCKPRSATRREQAQEPVSVCVVPTLWACARTRPNKPQRLQLKSRLLFAGAGCRSAGASVGAQLQPRTQRTHASDHTFTCDRIIPSRWIGFAPRDTTVPCAHCPCRTTESALGFHSTPNETGTA